MSEFGAMNKFRKGQQPCVHFKPKDDLGYGFGNEHECFAPFEQGVHPCADAGGTVSFCENCGRDHHANGYDSCLGRVKKESVNLSVGSLKQTIQKILGESLKDKKAIKKPSSVALMKQIVGILTGLGFKVVSKQKTMGALKTWLNPVESKNYDPNVDTMTYDEFEKHIQKYRSSGVTAAVYKKALDAAHLNVRVSGDNYETRLVGDNFEVIVPSKGERSDMGAALFVQVFAGKFANLERSGYDTDDLRFGECVIHESTVRTRDGIEWTGDYNSIIKALVRFDGSGNYDAILSGKIPISHEALSSLKKQKVVKRVQTGPSFDPKPSRAGGRTRTPLNYAKTLKEFEKAIAAYADNWTEFTSESPDVEPQDAAHDAAEGFFYEYPEWERWAAVLGQSKYVTKEIVADHVYDAMMKGSHKRT